MQWPFSVTTATKKPNQNQSFTVIIIIYSSKKKWKATFIFWLWIGGRNSLLSKLETHVGIQSGGSRWPRILVRLEILVWTPSRSDWSPLGPITSRGRFVQHSVKTIDDPPPPPQKKKKQTPHLSPSDRIFLIRP